MSCEHFDEKENNKPKQEIHKLSSMNMKAHTPIDTVYKYIKDIYKVRLTNYFRDSMIIKTYLQIGNFYSTEFSYDTVLQNILDTVLIKNVDFEKLNSVKVYRNEFYTIKDDNIYFTLYFDADTLAYKIMYAVYYYGKRKNKIWHVGTDRSWISGIPITGKHFIDDSEDLMIMNPKTWWNKWTDDHFENGLKLDQNRMIVIFDLDSLIFDHYFGIRAFRDMVIFENGHT